MLRSGRTGPAEGDESRNQRSGPFVGEFVVESPVVCVLTRFGLRRPWHLIQTYLAYCWLVRRVRRVAPGGLIGSVFLIESATTCWSLSLWRDEGAIPHFGASVVEHVLVANDVFKRLRFYQDRPELWSTKWRLIRASTNLNWEGCDSGGIVMREEPIEA